MAGTAFYRYKFLIGRNLRTQSLSVQKVEARIAWKVINRATSLGMPTSRKVDAAGEFVSQLFGALGIQF
jgi:hypothetical protein